jgi:putative transcriptional regulator
MKKKTREKNSAFSKISAGLEDAMAYHRGEQVLTVRDIELPPRPRLIKASEVLALRRTMGVSQAVFARLLNVSARTVQSWEVGARQPSDAALRLLHIAKKYPQILLDDLAA